jgi:photosystem II stability/assembly factor-like uncharacterized protein
MLVLLGVLGWLMPSKALLVTPNPEFGVVYKLTAHDTLFDIQILDNQGWAVGDHGLLLMTEDGGNTWHATRAPTNAALLGLDMTLKSRGAAVGQEGAILYTEDNGRHWSKVETGIHARLFSVSLDDSGVGLAVGEFGTLLRTDDYGQSWVALTPDWGRLLGLPDVPHLYDVLMEDRNTALVVGEFGIVMRSKDGGGTWSLLNRGDESIFAVRKTSNGNYWCLGQSGLLLRARNAGLAWERIETGQQFGLLDMHLDARGRGILIGMEGIFTTADGGQTWYSNPTVNSPLPRQFAVAAATDGAYLLAGAFGSIVRVKNPSTR